jgi:hypothetical protein
MEIVAKGRGPVVALRQKEAAKQRLKPMKRIDRT